jgi:hypothetical protein
VSNRWRFNCLCQLWAYGGLLSKVKLISFLRKLTMYLLVNSSDFICKLSVMCSIPVICWINLMYLINLQEKTCWKGRAAYCCRSTIYLFKSLYSTGCAIKRKQVTTITSFINTVLLKHIFFSSFIRIHHNCLLFVLDLLDRQSQPCLDFECTLLQLFNYL